MGDDARPAKEASHRHRLTCVRDCDVYGRLALAAGRLALENGWPPGSARSLIGKLGVVRARIHEPRRRRSRTCNTSENFSARFSFAKLARGSASGAFIWLRRH